MSNDNPATDKITFTFDDQELAHLFDTAQDAYMAAIEEISTREDIPHNLIDSSPETDYIPVTIGFDKTSSAYQLGDNQFHGAAYYYHDWLVMDVDLDMTMEQFFQLVQNELDFLDP
jgi:hypothetical protein